MRSKTVEHNKVKLHLTSLGCAKNQVDSELMLGRFQQAGWTITEQPAEADTIIVNTCSFIESAIDESIDTILELARYKTEGSCRRLIVAGCLPERFREKMIETLPEVDVFLGTGAYDQVLQAAEGRLDKSCVLTDPNAIMLQRHDDLKIQSTAYLSYLKIAEGCNRYCTYCIIPKLRGRQRSRPVEDIVSEAKALVASRTKELVLVAQDTTSYGQDLNPPENFNRLLSRLSEVSGKTWIRFLYGHPESFEVPIIETVAESSNICSYFDIPIQHVSSRVLKKMGRRYTQKNLYALFDRIRKKIPDAALRTTVIVGFPGETDNDFELLMNFVQTVRFDHLGVFVYSDAEDLPSHKLASHVAPGVASKRRERLMARQAEISLDHNRKYVGKVCPVIVEEKLEDGLYVGRTMFQAPEVDGLTYVRSNDLIIGSFYDVRILDALEYDLIGESV